jgi:hypothetical protein
MCIANSLEGHSKQFSITDVIIVIVRMGGFDTVNMNKILERTGGDLGFAMRVHVLEVTRGRVPFTCA